MELTHYTNYQQFKAALDAEMMRTAEGFVRIGYLLSYAGETNIVNEGGYGTVNDFAKAEYGIDATQVSRFVNIYKRFGVPGEPRLMDQFVNHGVAKLGIMLTLPDYINEEISSDYSKAEINVLKKEYEAEELITDLEVMMEEKDEVQQSLPDELKKCVYQLVHDYPTEYEYIYKAYDTEDLKEALAPNGECAYNIRIAGKGRLSIFMKPDVITVINLRSSEKEEYSWQQLFDAIQEHVGMGNSAKESWENCFNEEWPLAEKKPQPKVEQPKEATVQQSKPKKETKVKTPAPKKEKPQEKAKSEPEVPTSDKLSQVESEVLTGEVEDIAPVQTDYKETIRGYKAKVRSDIRIMEDKCEKDEWDMVISKATDIIERAKRIREYYKKMEVDE